MRTSFYVFFFALSACELNHPTFVLPDARIAIDTPIGDAPVAPEDQGMREVGARDAAADSSVLDDVGRIDLGPTLDAAFDVGADLTDTFDVALDLGDEQGAVIDATHDAARDGAPDASDVPDVPDVPAAVPRLTAALRRGLQ